MTSRFGGPAFVVGDLEVTVVDTTVPRAPTESERAALQKYFARPEAWDPQSGRPYRLYGVVLEGIDGLVLTYPAPSGSGKAPDRPRAR